MLDHNVYHVSNFHTSKRYQLSLDTSELKTNISALINVDIQHAINITEYYND